MEKLLAILIMYMNKEMLLRPKYLVMIGVC